ncbi:MAG: hypothetical protein QY314_03240 [Candidatus Dojkabacteria bacterium]|nr:MAG: hypothetical protein QY314_03240 [Candidatus Dojkabacteria bacterium]
MSPHSLRELKKDMLRLYSTWKAQKYSYCPAFKGNVSFSSLGWNHIIGNKTKKRPPQDVYQRLGVLPLAKIIIETSSTIQDIRFEYGIIFYSFDAVLNSNGTLKKVRVVLKEDKQGNKIFLSVISLKMNKRVPHALAHWHTHYVE